MTADAPECDRRPASALKTFRWRMLLFGAGLLIIAVIIARQWGVHPLVGQPAPTFTAPLMGGGILDLSQHLGKEVVLLDFWATWCPPCRRGLPAIAAIAETYHGKGAVVYAINLMEPESVVGAYLKEADLRLPVAFDADGGIARLYEVSGIPQTVFIGKDGIIRDVHVGVSLGFESAVKRQIAALLAAPVAGNQE